MKRQTLIQYVIQDKQTGWFYPYTSNVPLRMWQKFKDEKGKEYQVVKVEELTTYYN